MQSNIIRVSLALIASATLITACSTHDDDTQPLDTPQTQTEQRTFTVSIPATIKGDASLTKALTIGGTDDAPTAIGRFEESEKVYVYNETQQQFLSGTLSPSDISTNGKSCTLSGTLTGNISADDELTLFYNMNYYDSDEPIYSQFDYVYQSGSSSGLIDGGIATGVTVVSYENSILTTNKPAEITLLQSVFKFKFVDEDNQPICIKNIIIESKNSGIASYYIPLNPVEHYDMNLVSAYFSSATSDYIYFSMCINESKSIGDVLTFTASDDEGNVYIGTKTAPDGGFENGKYYYTDPIVLYETDDLHQPSIVLTSVDRIEAPIFNQFFLSGVYDEDKNQYTPIECSISGRSKGYSFLTTGGQITLNKVNALNYERQFIYSSDDLELIIVGDCTISSNLIGIYLESDYELKLSGNGKLTITANSNFSAKNYNESDINSLASADHTVTLISKKYNNNNTYTWVYEVSPNQ